MNKRMKIMIIALVIVFGGIIAFNLFKKIMIKHFFAHFEPPAVTISAVKAVKKDWRPEINAVGNFVAINGVDVNSEATGNIVKIHFDSGEFVEKGAALIDIDDSVEQASLKFSQADLVLKEINFKRQTDLYARGATPQSSVDEARANLEEAKANVEKIQAQIKYKHITAPFTGQLGIRQVNLGQYVNLGQTSIVTLQALDPLYLQFNLPEQLFKKLHLNQVIHFTIDEYPHYQFTGNITAINSKADPTTHNILIQATVPNCPAKALANPAQSKLIVKCNAKLNNQNQVKQFAFVPGMFAAITLEEPVMNKAIVLPSTAISYSLYGDSVFVIEKTVNQKDKKESLFVKRVFVTTGDAQGNYTVITKGIKEGQLVVSSGELKLENNTRVVINNSVKLHDISNPDSLGQ